MADILFLRCINVAGWNPSEEEWSTAMDLISSEERERISRFRRKVDAKRALCGRLLIRYVVAKELGLGFREAKFSRTAENKPFLVDALPANIPATYNFNLSHHGSWVVIASHPYLLTGVDVMEVEWPRGCENAEAYFKLMSNCFAKYEWMTIRSAGRQQINLNQCNPGKNREGRSVDELLNEEKYWIVPSSAANGRLPPPGPPVLCHNKTSESKHSNGSAEEWAQLTEFSRHWTMKEAYIKAVGIGLGLEDLSRIKFTYAGRLQQKESKNSVESVRLEMDGIIRNDWNFRLLDLDNTHMVCVALGPVEDATASYKVTLPQASVKKVEKQVHSVRMEILNFENIINTAVS